MAKRMPKQKKRIYWKAKESAPDGVCESTLVWQIRCVKARTHTVVVNKRISRQVSSDKLRC